MSAVPIQDELLTVAGAAPRKRALFLLDGWPSFEQQHPMARALEDAGWECWFMPLAGTYINEEGARLVRVWPLVTMTTKRADIFSPIDVEQGNPSRLRSAVGRVLRARGMSAARDIIFAFRMTKEWRQYRSLARERVAALNPNCVITAQDRIRSALPVVAAARDLGIPIVLAACAGLFMPDGCAFLRKDNPDVRLDRGPGTRWGQLMLNRLVGGLQPEQVYHSRWGRMLYQPAGWYLATWLTGLTLPSFWYQGARFADAILVSGDDERLVCDHAGIPRSKIAAIGSSALQVQFEQRRDYERIRSELGVARCKVLVVVAVPQFWEHGMMDEATHFAFIDQFFAVLGKRSATIILSLHPKMDRARYQFRARAAGLQIAERPLLEILAAADFFIAAAYSTTIRWAMAVGIPSINLDLWDLNETTYRNVADYPSVRSWDAVEKWLDARIAEGPPKPSAGPPPMGLICDGQFGDRFVALIERMSGGYHCAVIS